LNILGKKCEKEGKRDREIEMERNKERTGRRIERNSEGV
jgi:hypothetical protein